MDVPIQVGCAVYDLASLKLPAPRMAALRLLGPGPGAAAPGPGPGPPAPPGRAMPVTAALRLAPGMLEFIHIYNRLRA